MKDIKDKVFLSTGITFSTEPKFVGSDGNYYSSTEVAEMFNKMKAKITGTIPGCMCYYNGCEKCAGNWFRK